jgi:hypothetical protein
MPSVGQSPVPPAASAVRERIVSTLVDGFSEWWQMPLLALAALTLIALVIWTYRRDAADLPWPARLLLAGLRLGAITVVGIALLDLQRTTERELVLPSRVAVLVDASASMSLPAARSEADGAPGSAPAGAASRAGAAAAVLDAAGLLGALAERHEVSVWRFEADAERLVTLPQRGVTEPGEAGPEDGAADASGDGASSAGWRDRLRPAGYETRLGEALAAVLDREPRGLLAGIVVLTDGASNAGTDPVAVAGACAAAEVSIHPLGFGSDRLPANVRVADVVAPSRAVPGDGFAVVAYLQAQGLDRSDATVELLEAAAGQPGAAATAPARSIAIRDVVLGPDGDLVPVRFDVPGLATPGRRALTVRVRLPAQDRTPADDAQQVEVDVVEQVTQVLLVAGGPTREYQFARSVLHRDKSFAVDVLLGTALPGISQDARRMLDQFPDSDAALGGYDAIVAFDFDWRLLDVAAQARLERWVARESGGMIFFSGAVGTERWQGAVEALTVRGLLPVEGAGAGRLGAGQAIVSAEPMRLEFTRAGQEAEFLWLAPTAAASRTIWEEFRGVHACIGSGAAKPGATVYARVVPPAGAAGADARPIFIAGQYYGSGSTVVVASGELWRLRGIGDAAYERIVTQLVRHVAQGRLLRGSGRGRLLVDRDRFPVGGSVAVRLVLAEPAPAEPRPRCRAIAPDGSTVPVPLEAEPSRPDMLRGGFVASREGSWQIECDLGPGDDARLTRRVQAQLPDRELARPQLDRGLLEQVARASGREPEYPTSASWTAADSARVAATIPDRSRREYETASADNAFKRRLNTILLAAGVGMLCLEWITRRLLRLA